MMGIRTKRLALGITMTALFGGAVRPSIAVASQPPSIQMPFTVIPKLPTNQKSGVTGYYDLAMVPGQSQQLVLYVRNESSEPIHVQMDSANALTAVNGGIEYVTQRALAHGRLLNSDFYLRESIQLPASVRVGAHQTVPVRFRVVAPKSREGTYLGGILFSNNNRSGNSVRRVGKGNVSFAIHSRVAFAIAIQMDMPKPLPPSFRFGSVSLSSVPAGSELDIRMVNASPAILKELRGTYAVVDDRTGVTALSGNLGPLTMAPESEMDFPVMWNNTLSPGHYTVRLTANQSWAKGQVLRHSTGLTIGVKQLVQYHNATGRNPLPFYIPVWVYVAFGLTLIFLVGGAYWLGGRRRKSEPKNDDGRSDHFE